MSKTQQEFIFSDFFLKTKNMHVCFFFLFMTINPLEMLHTGPLSFAAGEKAPRLRTESLCIVEDENNYSK